MAESTQIKAVAGAATLDAVDEAQAEIESMVRVVLAERVADGYLDMPAHEVLILARKVAAESRLTLKRLVWTSYCSGRDYNTTQDAYDQPTRVDIPRRPTVEFEQKKR